jgi:hypothetical protein
VRTEGQSVKITRHEKSLLTNRGRKKREFFILQLISLEYNCLFQKKSITTQHKYSATYENLTFDSLYFPFLGRINRPFVLLFRGLLSMKYFLTHSLTKNLRSLDDNRYQLWIVIFILRCEAAPRGINFCCATRQRRDRLHTFEFSQIILTVLRITIMLQFYFMIIHCF